MTLLEVRWHDGNLDSGPCEYCYLAIYSVDGSTFWKSRRLKGKQRLGLEVWRREGCREFIRKVDKREEEECSVMEDFR